MDLSEVYIPDAYHTRQEGGRLLRVPSGRDREIHRAIYERIRTLAPVCWQPDQIHARIALAFDRNPNWKALRTDIRNCFETVPQVHVTRRIKELPIRRNLRDSLINVYQPLDQGLPTGSPLAAWLAELVLRDIDEAMQEFPHYFRYVDDICVLGDEATCQQALQRLGQPLAVFGMQLNDSKTRIVAAGELVFLGRSYGRRADALLFEVDLGGETFRLPNDKSVHLEVRNTEDSFLQKGPRLIYGVRSLLNRLSQQPTPYLLETLMLRPDCAEPTLRAIIQEPESILDRRTPAALHHKIWRQYDRQVKAPSKTGPPYPIGPAGEVFRWLYLTNTIMKTGRLPEHYQEIEAEWAVACAALRAGAYEPYHQKIKRAFKEEYALRTGPTRLPEIKTFFEKAA